MHPQLCRLLFHLFEKDAVKGVYDLTLGHEILCDKGDYCRSLREDEDGGVDPCEGPIEEQEDGDLWEVQEGEKEGEGDNREDEKGEDAREEWGKEGGVADKVEYALRRRLDLELWELQADPGECTHVEGVCPRGPRQLVQKEGIVDGRLEQRCSGGGPRVVGVGVGVGHGY